MSWPFIVFLGPLGGGPSFFGTNVGMQVHSTELFVFFLVLLAGAILFVVAKLLCVTKRFKWQDMVVGGCSWASCFLLGHVTDLAVSFAGACC